MLNKIIKIVVIYLLLFSSIIIAAEQPKLTHGLTALTPKYKAPSLAFLNLDEERVDIKTLKGKIVIVNFWATWCPPCRREMASLERLYQSTQDDNVVVLAVNVGEDDETVFSFLGEIEPSPNFTILFDTNAASLKAWSVKGLPTTYVVDKNGFVVYRAVGGREFDHPELIKKVVGLN